MCSTKMAKKRFVRGGTTLNFVSNVIVTPRGAKQEQNSLRAQSVKHVSRGESTDVYCSNVISGLIVCTV